MLFFSPVSTDRDAGLRAGVSLPALVFGLVWSAARHSMSMSRYGQKPEAETTGNHQLA